MNERNFIQPDFHDATWELSPSCTQLTNVVERLRRFYQLHLGDEGVLTPIHTVLNPEKHGVRYFDVDTWLLFYYGGFTVRVERHFRSISGPHPAKLLYKSWQTHRSTWIATLQIVDAMFYNEALIIERLTDAIKAHEFFIAPRSYKDTVAY